ncbi:MAG: DUF2961 domain-containing protein, partial [Chloroflexi bacterium]|nr:DUF2961 domain-containing protein [Chloroflexota bacterium]
MAPHDFRRARELFFLCALFLSAAEGCATPTVQILPTPAAAPQTPANIVVADAPTPRAPSIPIQPTPPPPAPPSFFEERVANLFDLARLPVMEQTVTTQFTSRNWFHREHFFDFFIDDGNFEGDKYGWVDENGARQSYRIVTADDGKPEYEIVPRSAGPGYIARIWFAQYQHQSYNNPTDKSKDPEWANWGNLGEVGNIRFYFDDEPTPRVDFSIKDLFVGKNSFPAPLAAFYASANGGNINYVPIPFQKALRIATTGKPRLMQIQIKRFADSNPALASVTGAP